MRILFFALIFLIASQGLAKTFIYCSEGSPSIFNPQLATDGTTFNASSRTIYNRLVDFKPGSTEIMPSLATDWRVGKDGKTYTFNLRKGVKFHKSKLFTPTREFNADDVIFSFKRMMDKTHPYHTVNGGTYKYFQSMDMGKLIKEVKKIDSHTIQFVLNRPEAPFVANMGMDFASILSAEYGEILAGKMKKEQMDTQPIGTGPFVFQRYVKDTMIRYKAHTDYFAGAPELKRLVFAITPDPSVRTQKLKAGECHLIAEPSPIDLKELKSHPRVRVLQAPGLNVGYIAFNVEKKPFDNVKVRRAINHALNREAYINAIYLKNATKAKNPIPPIMWSYNKETKDYNYNPELAKKLLKEAGLAKGFSFELWTLPVSRPYNPNGKKMGEMIQADLAKVGVKVKLISYDWPTYLAKSRNGEHEAIQIGWTGDNGDPDNFLNVLLGCAGIKGGSNLARWCNPEFMKLVLQARQSSNQQKRTELYEKAQKVFKKEAPWVTLAHATVFRAMSDKVKGYQIHPLGTEKFAVLKLED